MPSRLAFAQRDRMPKLVRGQHVPVGVATVLVRPQRQPDQRDGAQHRQRGPHVQAPAGHHDVVGHPGRAAFGGEDHPVTVAGQDAPADRDLGRVEVAIRDRDQDGAHAALGRRPL